MMLMYSRGRRITSKSSLSKKIVAVTAADPKNPSCMKTRSMEKATPAMATRVRNRWCSRFRMVKGIFMASRGGPFLGVDFYIDLMIDQLGGCCTIIQPDANLDRPAIHFRPRVDVVNLVSADHDADHDYLPLELCFLALLVFGQRPACDPGFVPFANLGDIGFVDLGHHFHLARVA